MIVARTVDEVRAALRSLPRPLGLVTTMGALHEGHLTLVRTATQRCASVAASIFVNPTQFGPGEDYAGYPRDESRDARLLEEAGVSVVFMPAANEMYTADASTTVTVSGTVTEGFEGERRPGHFAGVATVVLKLLLIVRPNAAFFGEKDAQQLAVIRRMVRDLDVPTEIIGVPTVREPDGLARSSRNTYLSREERAAAAGLYRALLAGIRAAAETGSPEAAVAAATAALATPAGSPRFDVDYVAVVDADTFAPEETIGPRSLLITAARLGTTRLIDNVSLAPLPPGEHLSLAHHSAYPAGDATA